MLQQTQTERVVLFYQNFLARFPTIQALADAPLSDVVRAWQGLGYNRRAKYLHSAAKMIIEKHGFVPHSFVALSALPGVGRYTACAVLVFAWDEPEILIETNIRTVFIRHFFPRSKKVSDSSLYPYLKQALDRKKPREWHWALMDYGVYLKKTEGNAAKRSAHHIQQKPFKGSDREIRGAILKALALGALSSNVLPFEKKRIRVQLTALVNDGLIARRGKTYRLAD